MNDPIQTEPVICGTQPAGQPCDVIVYGDDSTATAVIVYGDDATMTQTPTVTTVATVGQLPSTGTTSAPVVTAAGVTLILGVLLARIARRTVTA